MQNQSVLETRALSTQQIQSLFDFAQQMEASYEKTKNFLGRAQLAPPKVVANLFFEPSTRTRLSFEMATTRLGLSCLSMDSMSSTSLTKGESFADTILNVAAMQPDLIVIRYGDSRELDELLPTLNIPVISAGTGVLAHPTQALLDAYTILKERKKIAGERVLIVGDIRHSRVARSNVDVLTRMGAEIGICGPPLFMPESHLFPHVKRFNRIEDGIAWATVLMGLRIQLERHDSKEIHSEKVVKTFTEYEINLSRLSKFIDDGIVMHPGPINHGVEFAPGVLQDQRSRVLSQVTNGVFIRASLLAHILDLARI